MQVQLSYDSSLAVMGVKAFSKHYVKLQTHNALIPCYEPSHLFYIAHKCIHSDFMTPFTDVNVQSQSLHAEAIVSCELWENMTSEGLAFSHLCNLDLSSRSYSFAYNCNLTKFERNWFKNENQRSQFYSFAEIHITELISFECRINKTEMALGSKDWIAVQTFFCNHQF